MQGGQDVRTATSICAVSQDVTLPLYHLDSICPSPPLILLEPLHQHPINEHALVQQLIGKLQSYDPVGIVGEDMGEGGFDRVAGREGECRGGGREGLRGVCVQILSLKGVLGRGRKVWHGQWIPTMISEMMQERYVEVDIQRLQVAIISKRSSVVMAACAEANYFRNP